MGSLEELRVNYRLLMSKAVEKYEKTEIGSADAKNVLSEIERLHALIQDVDDKIEKRDAAFRKEIIEEAKETERKMEAEKKEAERKKEVELAALRESEEKKLDRKTNIIVAGITGGCGIFSGLMRIQRQNSMINTVLDFSKSDDVTGCSKQSLFRSLLGDFFKM